MVTLKEVLAQPIAEYAWDIDKLAKLNGKEVSGIEVTGEWRGDIHSFILSCTDGTKFHFCTTNSESIAVEIEEQING